MKIIVAALVLFLSTTGFTQTKAEEHTETICSTADASVCAHIGHMVNFTSQGESQFMAHVMPPTGVSITEMNIVLTMDMGGGHQHGTSPVSITEVGPGKFQVTKAYFVMSGEWIVHMSFKANGQDLKIDIPVQIK